MSTAIAIEPLTAYHGVPAVKQFYLDRVRMHREADELVKGRYWEHGKGCAVGCTIHGSEHADYESQLGIPRTLARLEDTMFERLPNDMAMAWPERFLNAPKVGADLSMVWPRFAVWLLVDESLGVIRFAKNEKTRKAITDVAALWQRVINGESVEFLRGEFRKAYDAAYAADAAAAAAAYAADAADGGVGGGARIKHWQAMSDKLIELMAAA